MAFVLSAERDADVSVSFRRYREYLTKEKDRFPPGAYALATADWYFSPDDHRCPHDAWLDSLTICQKLDSMAGEPSRRTRGIVVRLLGAYHDGFIELTHHGVTRYAIAGAAEPARPADWRFDEFRLGPSGKLLHEIEWAGGAADGFRWLIESEDVSFRWLPRHEALIS